MDEKREISRVFGLSKQESRVLNALDVNSSPRIVAEITHVSKVPRMTVQAILIRLLNRGLVGRLRQNHRFIYYRKTPQDLVAELFPEKRLPSGTIVIPINPSLNIAVHHGDKEMLDLYRRLIERNRQGRVYGAQSSKSVEIILREVPAKIVAKLNKAIVDNDIVMESVIEEDFLRTAKTVLKDRAREWAVNFSKRLSVIYVVPKGLIPAGIDFVLFGETVLIMDWESKTAIEIVERRIFQMVFLLYEMYKKVGRKTESRLLVEGDSTK